MGNKNGIVKNWEVVQRELAAWRALKPIHIKTYRDAEGIVEKAHKGWNIVTEFIRIAPRTTGYSLLAAVTVLAAAIVAVWLA